MTKSKLLSVSVVALIALNLMFIGFQFFKSEPPHDRRHLPPHHRKESPRDYIIKKLDLNDTQIVDYESLIDSHRTHITKTEQQLHTLKQQLFELLADSNTTKEKELLHRIGNLNNDIDSLHMDHFKALKALCREDQLKSFDELSKELASLFGRPDQGRPHKKH